MLSVQEEARMLSGRERWFADILQAGLDTRVLAEPDILAHVTPAVLAGSLPKDVLVKLFDAALTSGTISPQAVLKVATPELIAEHVKGPLVWACFVAAAERAGIAKGTDDAHARELLRRAVGAGLRETVLMPDDVVRHVDAKVLGHHFPDALTTKLLEVSLAAGKMNPELIVETLGVEAIAKHAPTPVVWACLVELAQSLLAEEAPAPGLPHGTPPPAHHPDLVKPAGDAFTLAAKPGAATPVSRPTPPTLEFLDDDVASVLVDLDAADTPAPPKRSRAPSAS
jgi:hypothetical protein